MTIEFLDQRDHVDGPGGFGEIDHARINTAMRIERKIFDAQMLGSLVVGEIIEQDRAEDGALGFYIRGKSADAVIGCGHAESISSSWKCHEQTNSRRVVKARRIVGKQSPNKK